jgi:hypothetical protein
VIIGSIPLTWYYTSITRSLVDLPHLFNVYFWPNVSQFVLLMSRAKIPLTWHYTSITRSFIDLIHRFGVCLCFIVSQVCSSNDHSKNTTHLTLSHNHLLTHRLNPPLYYIFNLWFNISRFVLLMNTSLTGR